MRLKIGIDHSKCSGCRTCEMVCALVIFKTCDPKQSLVKIISSFPESNSYKVKVKGCKLCGECLDTCPTGALFRREASTPKTELREGR